MSRRQVSILGFLIMSAMIMTENLEGQVIKTAILEKGAGVEGLKSLLQSEKYDVVAIKPDDVSFDKLFEYDVLILGSCDVSDRITADIRDYVENGGRVLINHRACGSPSQPDSFLFPEVFVARNSKSQCSISPLSENKHPIIAGISGEFNYSYNDHIRLVPGRLGTVVAKDQHGNPVVIVGSFGKGKVVGNGMASGLWTGNVEKAPEGGERQIILNAMKWLAVPPVSALSAEERGAIKESIRKKHELRRQQELADREQKTTEWFSDDLIRSRCLQREPIESLGGKFFMIARIDICCGYERTRQNLRMLKNMGVTDIIHMTIRGNQIYHITAAPGAYLIFGKSDNLMDLAKAAGKENIGIWLKLQTGEFLPKGENNQLCAKDAEGKPYLYGSMRIGDFLSEDYRKMLYVLIDEYAAKYNQFGSIKGLYFDMPFVAWPDFHGDDLELFKTYCQKTFGEALPGDIGDKLKLETKWCDPGDKSWRRFVLFKQWVCEEFVRDISTYVRNKGLEFAIQITPSTRSRNGWAWAHNPARLAKHAKWIFNYPGSWAGEAIYALPKTMPGFFAKNTWGTFNTHSLRGHEGGIGFPFTRYLYPVLLGETGRVKDESVKHIRNCREWAGGAILARVALLDNQNNLLLRFGDARDEYDNQIKLMQQLSLCLDPDSILVESTDAYANYRVLIAPPYSVGGLAEETLRALRSYVENGGIIISLNAKWSTARPDLTGETDLTEKMAGSGPGVQSADGLLTFRENVLGKGKIITLLTPDMSSTTNDNQMKVEAAFAGLVAQSAQPEITVVNAAGQGNAVQVITTLKKNNWVAVSLLPEQSAPVKCILKVDMEKLGVKKAGYRVLLLGRDMEMSPPGDYAGLKYWTADQLKKGFAVSILSDNDIDFKKLPANIDLSDYAQSSKDYINRNLRSNWDDPERRNQRHYEYEIVVIAPYDELTIASEKI